MVNIHPEGLAVEVVRNQHTFLVGVAGRHEILCLRGTTGNGQGMRLLETLAVNIIDPTGIDHFAIGIQGRIEFLVGDTCIGQTFVLDGHVLLCIQHVPQTVCFSLSDRHII